MVNNKYTKRLLTLSLLWVCSSSANAHLFRPDSVNELILDIVLANTNGQNDVIDLGGCTFELSQINNTNIRGPNALPIIQPDIRIGTPHSLTIKNGSIEISLESGIQARHIEVASGASLYLENVTLKHGYAAGTFPLGAGGSILNNFFGMLSLKTVAMISNSAEYGGGAIYNYGTLSIGYSTFDHNNTRQYGGAIYIDSGVINLFNSTFANNSASIAGGAIYSVGFINSMINNTIALNSAGQGGGILSGTIPMNIFISNIVAANTAGTDPDISDPFIPNNPQYNLIGTTAGNSITTTGNNIVQPSGGAPVDPGLEPLSYNGGHTWTMALSPTSLAINTGYNPLALNFDQRGHGYKRTSGGAADIGAYELQFCELDSDHDGVCNENDNCPCRFNPSQDDCNHNGVGDPCDDCPCPCDREPCDDTCGPCPPHHEPGPCDPDGCHRCPSHDDRTDGEHDDDDCGCPLVATLNKPSFA